MTAPCVKQSNKSQHWHVPSQNYICLYICLSFPLDTVSSEEQYILPTLERRLVPLAWLATRANFLQLPPLGRALFPHTAWHEIHSLHRKEETYVIIQVWRLLSYCSHRALQKCSWTDKGSSLCVNISIALNFSGYKGYGETVLQSTLVGS